MDIGIINAAKLGVRNPLPISWINRLDAPTHLPVWATIGQLTSIQATNLQCQIAYDQSTWDYKKIGTNNELGRYQVSTTMLEKYGILAPGSNASYGTDCVNYRASWQQIAVRSTNSYSNYQYNITSLTAFLSSTVAQDHLNYQIIYDTYTELTRNGSILTTDTAEVVAGMIYVGMTLGTGSTGSSANVVGSGAYAWRYYNAGVGAPAYNSGRYAITVLSQ